MRNGKSHIKISFRLRFFVREWRCDCDFPSDSLLSKSFFCFWTKNLFEFCSAKPLRPSPLPSKIDMDATPSQRSLPTAMSYFTQENSFWKWIWKTMGEVDLDFKWANAYSESWIEVCPSFFFDQRQGDCDFQFKSDHMRKIFRSVLHGLLWAYALRQALSSENLQGASLSRISFSNEDRQDYRQMESNSSPSSRPESTPEMVGLTTETCVTPSVR